MYLAEVDQFSPFDDARPLHPLALAAMVVLGVATLLLPRRYSLLPMLIMACFISQSQRIVILGANFNMLRVMVLFGWARLALRGEVRSLRWLAMDWILILWAIARTVVYTLQQGEGQALVYQLGQSFDGVGMYFLFRMLLREWEDFDRVVVSFVLVSIPVALCFAVELSTGRNLFSFLGGVPLITEIREGHLRCQGPYPHAIIAGCFWATLLPVFIAQWWQKREGKAMAVVGCAMSMLIVVASWSSTPLGAVMAGVVGYMFFFVRARMKMVRYAIWSFLLIMHFLVMKGPVWSLLSHIDLAGGSTGEYRAELISLAVQNLGGWWLLGTKSITAWNPDYYDVTNQYIMEGVTGGLLTLVLFVMLLYLGFRYTGRSWRRMSGDRGKLTFTWALGVSLFVHLMNFFGVSYFGTIILIWYLQLAMIACIFERTEISRTTAVERWRQWLRRREYHARAPVPGNVPQNVTAPSARRPASA